jgi:NAD+ synthase (glutamine-hydrolysing)
MSNILRIALAQINVTVGDFQGNEKIILDNIKKAKKLNVDLIVFPELSITGYPPEDLLLRPQFIEDNVKSLQRIIPHTKNITAILGFADYVDNKLYNSAAALCDGKLCGIYHKIHLPNYGVFDEKRYFNRGNEAVIFELNGIKIGLSICEDLWISDSVIETEALFGNAEIIVNISASPYCSGKIEEREKLVIDRAEKNRVFMLYANLIGGQDELVFDGSSLIANEDGDIVVQGKEFDEDLLLYDIDVSAIRDKRKKDVSFNNRKKNFTAKYKLNSLKLQQTVPGISILPLKKVELRIKLDPVSEVYHALVLGTRDYVHKNGFKKVVLGLSGGIDSALTAAIATEALGEKNVVCIAMPSKFSSESSLTDAEQLAKNLSIEYKVIPIHTVYEKYLEIIEDEFLGLPFDVAEENIQARIRGNIIMALSNKFGWLALTTGNKSEVSVGYCTLYGDMAGGLAVIKDVPKLLVYKLSENVNQIKGREIIPQNTINKSPSAELRPDQKDEDSLPPYHILDLILTDYIENNLSLQQIITKGYDEQTVRNVIRLVDLNEYKRRQGAPGIKITPRAFGKDRRMPITNRYQ